ncbi:class F sortase [Halobacillus yeomjeoni]|uniref:class F sortase n=1 Tax=Halobacillus yeomjeoni TaxID=311194 RepID=UPI001CD4CE49|nr:class F sortase [Halobacillus yeomjeoni]MCA0984038.1 class F sortase [Halobacillus yeomjeoni]
MKKIWFPVTLGFLVFIVSFQLLKDEPAKEARVLSSSSPKNTEVTNIGTEWVKDDLESAPIKKNYTPATVVGENDGTGIRPDRIVIPSIEVDAKVQAKGYTKDGGMAVPDSVTDVGWFEPGTEPGRRGNAVIAGHVDGQYGPAVFFDLKKLQSGDELHVYDKKGNRLTYTVQEVVAYPVDQAPIRKLFGPTNKKALNLITCTGTYDKSAGGYLERLAVYTVLTDRTKA